MTASTRRHSLRLHLAIGTALAGGTLFAGAGAGAAQELPDGGTVVVGTPATITRDAAGKNMNVGLTGAATVINWNTFNITGVSASDPSTVNFSQTLPDSVVINRVVGPDRSTIFNGRITTNSVPLSGLPSEQQNTTVWLLNRNGILIGGNSAIDAGGFMASTLDICPVAGCAGVVDSASLSRASTEMEGMLRVFGEAANTATLIVQGPSSITSRNALVLVGGSVEVQAGSRLTAAGDVNLVAATDVQVSRPGSPLIFRINAGSSLPSTLVSARGSVSGSSVVLAAARPDALAEALLSVGGTITANGVGTGARGVVLLGGTGTTESATAVPGDQSALAPDPVIRFQPGAAGPVRIESNASLTAEALDVIVNSNRSVTLEGPVSAARDYRVTGTSVGLGLDIPGVTPVVPVTQTAGGVVTVRALTGGITGLGGLELRSNRSGATGGALTLAAAGALQFGTATAVIGGNEGTGGSSDIRVLEGTTTTLTRFGGLVARSFGAIPGVGESSPRPLTLYGDTRIDAVTLDRALDLAIENGGGTTGTLALRTVTTGVRPIDNGSGVSAPDDIRISTAGSARLGAVESRTGSIQITARDGDVTGRAEATGGFGYATLRASVARAATVSTAAAGDGSVYVYAGRTSSGALTATGTNGLAKIGRALAGDDAVVLAQKIDAGIVAAGAVIAGSPAVGTAGGSATLHAYGHDLTPNAIDLSVVEVGAGAGSGTRAGLDVQLIANAAGGTISAGALRADRSVSVLAGTGAAGATGTATIAGEVIAGRVDAAGSYTVTGGQVTLGAAGTPVTQSAPGEVTIRATGSGIRGLGTLSLQSNSNGIGDQPLTILSAGAIDFAPTTQLLAGTGSSTGNTDLLIYQDGSATLSRFGDVRARRMRSAADLPTLTLYGNAVFGAVDLDRSLDLSVENGGGGALGTLTTGALRLGVNVATAGDGTATADTLTLRTAGSARFESVSSATGSLLITAVDGDVTGPALTAGGYGRVNLTAARANASVVPPIVDGAVVLLAGRDAGGGQTASGTNGRALLGDVVAGSDVRVEAQAIDASTIRSDRGGLVLRAGAVDGAIPFGAFESLAVGSATAGLAALLESSGSLRVGTVDTGSTAVPGTTTGGVRLDAVDDIRIGVASATPADPGGMTARLGDIALASRQGDVTGIEAAGVFGRVDLSALDGNVYVTAQAQSPDATPAGLVQLGSVFAQTSEALTGSTDVPARGNIFAVGRVVDVTRAETAVAGATGGGRGGSLYLQAREGSASDDVHLTLGTGSIGTTARLIAGSGSLGGAIDPNGSVFVGTLEAGRNRLVAADTVLPDTIEIRASNTVRAATLTSRSGGVLVTADNGDVTGDLAGSGRTTISVAPENPGAPGSGDIVYGGIAISAASPLANRGVVMLGATGAGGDVRVDARKIDAAAQTVRSDRGSVALTATAGDLSVGSAVAGVDVLLDASADTLSGRGAGNVIASFLTANRHVDVDADATATITDDVTAGGGDVAGYYHVAARGDVVLGGDATSDQLVDTDLQSALDDISITAGGDITGARRLTLRSNSGGVADGSGPSNGQRDLVLDARGAVAMALPDGLLLADRDVDATRLIGGTGTNPQSVVRARAGAGTTMTLGLVSARALRGFDSSPVAGNFRALADRVGETPLYHAGDIRIGRADVTEALGIFAYEGDAASNRLLQIDGAVSRTGNIALVASGEVRGYQLTAPEATTLEPYVASSLTAGGDRVDVYARSVLLGDVQAGAFAGVETFGGRLRFGTATTGTTAAIGDSGISLIAQTDLLATSAVAARGDVLAQATTGSVTGLVVPAAEATPGSPPDIVLQANDGNLTVRALGAGADTGLVAATELSANAGDGALSGGNVSIIGQRLAIGTATAGTGSLSVTARPGSAAAVDTGIFLRTGSAGTTATVIVSAGGGSGPSDTNGSAVVETLTSGTNAAVGGATALAGDSTITAAGNVRAGTVQSGTGSVSLIARDGGVTGLVDALGVVGRATITAATASSATDPAPAIANGTIGVFAGRDTGGLLTATGRNGLAKLGVLSAGGDIMILAQAIDATTVTADYGNLTARAYTADGVVSGSASDSLRITTARSGLGATLTSDGSIRSTEVTAGLRRTGVAGSLLIDAIETVSIGEGRSLTGHATVIARTGDVLATALAAAIGSVSQATDAAVADGNLSVYAGPAALGLPAATGATGLARIGSATAGNDVTVLAQRIDAGTVQAAAVSPTPLARGEASGTAKLQAFGHSATATDLAVTTVSAGTGFDTRRGLDVLLIADAAGGTLAATTIGADRDVAVRAGSGTDGIATIAGSVRAGQTDATGSYAVSGGQVTLGTADMAIEQSALGSVRIVSTVADIIGLGTLTLLSNSDGAGGEALTLESARGLVLPGESRLFGGLDTAAGDSDILVAEGPGATRTTFGQVRGRSLGGVPVTTPAGTPPAPVPLTLYGPTTFGTVDLDRTLDLTVRDGGGGELGTLTTGAVRLGRFPADGVSDNLVVNAVGTTRFASINAPADSTARSTGGISVTVTGAGQSIVADGAIEARDAIRLYAAQDVGTTTVTSTAGLVQIGATAGIASGDRVTASGGGLDVNAGIRAGYASLAARDAVAVTAGTIGVGSATAGTSLAMTANGVDTAAADGQALVLGIGEAGTTVALTAATGGVRATTLDAGLSRTGTLGDLTITAARSIAAAAARSGTGNVTLAARDGDVAATALTAAIGTPAQGTMAAVADGNVAVYAGRDAAGVQTATGSNGLALLGTVTAGNSVTVLAQKIDAATVQAAAVSTAPLAAGAASGTATLTAYAHDTTTADVVDLRVGTVRAGTDSTVRRGLDVSLAAAAGGGTLVATTIDAGRNATAVAGTGTNGVATVTGTVRAGRTDAAGAYTVRAGQVSLGTAGQTFEQSAAAATTVTAIAGGVTGAGALTLQSNRDGVGTEALEVRATGGSVAFDRSSTLQGGQVTANGSNVTVVASGGTSAIDVGTVQAVGSIATLTAAGALSTQGPVIAATATFGAGGAITTNGAVTAPALSMQAADSITVNGAVSTTNATLQGGRAVTTTGLGTVAATNVTLQAGSAQASGAITVGGTLTATSAATLRASGLITTSATLTAPTTTIQSGQIALGAAVNATTSLGLYNQAAAANRTRLGSIATTDGGFELNQTEFDLITTPSLTIGSGADDPGVATAVVRGVLQNVDIGALRIDAGTGRTALRVLGTGSANTITVSGALSINGGIPAADASRPGAASTRVLQLGGAVTGTTGEVGEVRVVNDGTGAGSTGAIATNGGVLDLRATRILAGRLGFIEDALAPGRDINRDFVSNPNSALYGAGANGYLTSGAPIELISTGQLKLQFSNFALLQNTSRPGAIPTGITINGVPSSAADAQALVLRSGSAARSNGFALFGRFQPIGTAETFFSTQAALLGSTYISNGATANGGVNPVAARLNGCLLSSASGGCLASSIAQPTLNVFDVTRDQVLRGSDDRVVTFDPLVGSNNEALFGDIAAGDQGFDLQPCPDGTTSAQCNPTGTAKP